jgi:multidrug resistance efflux pump
VRHKRILWLLALPVLALVVGQTFLSVVGGQTFLSVIAGQTSQDPVPSTQYSAPGTQYSAPSTQYSVPSTAYPALRTSPVDNTASSGRPVAPLSGVAARETKPKPDDDPSQPKDCFVTMQTTEIPAEESGRIKEFKVQEGQEVSEKTLLALIDDSQSQMAKRIAFYKLKAAEKDAENDVSVRYATKGKEIAEIEWQQGKDTNRLYKGAVTEFEIRRLEFKVQEQTLGIEEAQHKLGVARVTADEKRAELDATDLDIRRREIRSPCFGRVEKRHREVGEWVKPGDPVLQILQTDLVDVQGNMDASRLNAADVEGRPVRVTVSVKGRPEVFEGKVVFAALKVDPSGRSVVKAKVKNRKLNGQWLLCDGVEAHMVMDLNR